MVEPEGFEHALSSKNDCWSFDLLHLTFDLSFLRSLCVSSSLATAVSQTVATFKVPGENRPRNSAEISAKQLPLRPLRDRGFQGYLANMIQVGSGCIFVAASLSYHVLDVDDIGCIFVCLVDHETRERDEPCFSSSQEMKNASVPSAVTFWKSATSRK